MDWLNNLIQLAVQHNASDVHLSPGLPPVFRIMSDIRKVDWETLTEERISMVADHIYQLLDKPRRDHQTEKDVAFSVTDIARIRGNIYQHHEGTAIALRILPSSIPSLTSLKLSPVLNDLCAKKSGLVLVTGPTGSGKSTTLAGMIDEINTSRYAHIVTIEDPIEYVHQSKQCLIHQREVGSHTNSFSAAVRSALREDPDVILVGEMRDLETITHALQAAETGHLVFATLHTNSAAETIDRIIDVFPAAQQGQIRLMLSNTISAVIAQRLLPNIKNIGRVPVMEILVGTKAVQNVIREGKTHQLETLMQTGKQNGMQTFLQNFTQLSQRGMISPYVQFEEVF